MTKTKNDVLNARVLALYGDRASVTATTVGVLLRDWTVEYNGSVTARGVLEGLRVLRATFPAFMSQHDMGDVLSEALRVV